MDNKLQATIDIGSHSCILLIAAFEDKGDNPNSPHMVLVPKLQKVEVCRLGEDIYECGHITEARIQELTQIMTKFRMDLHALGADLKRELILRHLD